MTRAKSVNRLHLLSRVIAAAALVALSPVLLIAALVIKISSRGPLLFPATRVGLAGQPFTMLKFRTMRQAPSPGAQRITGARDARVFPAGRWLRRLKIDELPQLTNVVRGDMVLIGPRPEDPSIVADYYTPFMRQTLEVMPGLTSPGSLDYFGRERGLPVDPAEAESVYASTLLPRKIALDLVYVRNRCWKYDLQLVVRTVALMAGVRPLFPKRCAWERVEAGSLLSGTDRAAMLPPVAGAPT